MNYPSLFATIRLLALIVGVFLIGSLPLSGWIHSAGAVDPTVYDSSSSTNYSEAGGGWQQWDGGGHDGNQRYHEAGSEGAAATWQVTSLSGGDYEVGATWVEGSSEASSAPWKIYDGTTLITTVFVDNTQAPQGPVINGSPFQTLATVSITSGTLKVVANETPTGQVAVDAISVAAVSAPPPPTADLNWSNGGLSNQPTSVNTGESFNVTRTYTVSGADIGTPFNIANSHTVRLVIKTSTYFETIEVYLDDARLASEVRGNSLLSVGGETTQNATKHGFTLGSPLDIINRCQVDLIRW